jgi:hypothetical protein
MKDMKEQKMKTVVGLFDTFDEAKKAAGDLQSAGIPQDDISLVANNESGQYAANNADTTTDTITNTGHAVGRDAKVGAEIGAVAGLAIGLTGLAIPGLGWIAAAGWFGGMLLGAGTGAVIGGLTGALTHVGVPEEDATYYNEGVRRGGTLLAVRASDEQAHRVAEILGDDGAININERAEQYRSEGFVPGAAIAGTTTATLPSTTNTLPSAATTTVGSAAGHTARDLADNAAGAVERTEGSIPGVQTGGRAVDGSGAPDTRGITEKIADTVTGNRVDDKTGRPV